MQKLFFVYSLNPHLFKDDICEQLNHIYSNMQSKRNFKISQFALQISETLTSLNISHVLEANISNIFVDLFAKNFKKSQLDDKNQSEAFDLIIEAQGYQHFTREGKLIGSQILKQKILEK